MVIKVDNEAHDLLKQLCDIALKAGGIGNLQGVMVMLQSIQLVSTDEIMAVEE